MDLLEEALGDLEGRTVLILGLTYRENVKEVAFSTARKLRRELQHRGAIILGHDPLLSEAEQRAMKVRPVAIEPALAVDAIVVQAYHDAYAGLNWATFKGLRAVLDGRGALGMRSANNSPPSISTTCG